MYTAELLTPANYRVHLSVHGQKNGPREGAIYTQWITVCMIKRKETESFVTAHIVIMKLICLMLRDAVQVREDVQHMLLSEHGSIARATAHSAAESRLGLAEAEKAKGWAETGRGQASRHRLRGRPAKEKHLAGAEVIGKPHNL